MPSTHPKATGYPAVAAHEVARHALQAGGLDPSVSLGVSQVRP